MSEYSEEIHEKYHDQVEAINSQIVSTGKPRLAEVLVIEVLIAIDEVDKYFQDE